MSAAKLPAPTAEGPLLAWLLVALKPMSRTRVKELLRHGRVVVNGAAVTQFDHPLRPGDRVLIDRAPALGERGPRPAPLPVAYQDDAVVVIDKPAGLLSVATAAEKLDTAFARLNAALEAKKQGRPFVVHRLDRETSGLLLFARSAALRGVLQAGWPAVAKTYLAVVDGTPRPAEGVVENHLAEGTDLRVHKCGPDREGAMWAVTRYKTVASAGGRSLVEVYLETGRKHQIRFHMARMGCPVVGDQLYGLPGTPEGRLGLHAWRLAFDHPTTGKRVEVESPLPDELRDLVRGPDPAPAVKT